MQHACRSLHQRRPSALCLSHLNLNRLVSYDGWQHQQHGESEEPAICSQLCVNFAAVQTGNRCLEKFMVKVQADLKLMP